MAERSLGTAFFEFPTSGNRPLPRSEVTAGARHPGRLGTGISSFSRVGRPTDFEVSAPGNWNDSFSLSSAALLGYLTTFDSSAAGGCRKRSISFLHRNLVFARKTYSSGERRIKRWPLTPPELVVRFPLHAVKKLVARRFVRECGVVNLIFIGVKFELVGILHDRRLASRCGHGAFHINESAYFFAATDRGGLGERFSVRLVSFSSSHKSIRSATAYRFLRITERRARADDVFRLLVVAEADLDAQFVACADDEVSRGRRNHKARPRPHRQQRSGGNGGAKAHKRQGFRYGRHPKY